MINNGSVLNIKEKVGTLSKGDDWCIYEIVEVKSKRETKTICRMSLTSNIHRIIGICDYTIIEDAIRLGKVEVIGNKKITKPKDDKK